MMEEIKSNLNIYRQLIEDFTVKTQLSSDQKSLLFGSLDATIDINVLNRFESESNIEIPKEYKQFLSEVGNGTGDTWENAGIGPGLGILKVSFEDNKCFIFEDTVIDLVQPFEFTGEYNLEKWEALADQFTEWFDRYTQKFRNELLQLREPCFEEFIKLNGENPRNEYYENFDLNGILPVAGIGCGEYYFLVVTGESRGEIWIDHRDNWGGISPLLDDQGRRYRFDTWFNDWLKEEITHLQQKIGNADLSYL
ncbi:hypothetical protein [Sphingobacterium tabacisoli]|uniref:Knr4/Smi1-like domain-containing protein n=1 Tax=Sphingobacterium tabacisoli TaxID=2044855 RepID=A0ABW5L5P1_9SPHI|nr:hypothetical protein [Sphingobacterium tabacisoli]